VMVLMLIYWRITNTVKKNIDAAIHNSKEVGLKIKTWKSKYKLISHHQNAEQNRKIKTANKSF
jgi:hypothetical protein